MRRIVWRTSIANSSLPGTTGKYVKRPRSKLAASGNGRSISPDMTQRFFPQSVQDRRLERLVLVATLGRERAQLDRKAANVDAVAHRVALVGGVSLLQEIGDVIQNAVLGERQIFLEDLEFLIALRKVDQDLRLQARMNIFRQLKCG